METGNSTSLEDRIKIWRSELSGKLSPDEIDELQSHLEDDLNDLLGKGLSEGDAWLLAGHRIGSAETIKKEFQKVKDDKTPAINHLFYWGMLLFLSYGIIALATEIFRNMSDIGVPRVSRVILLLILLGLVYAFINNRRIVTKQHGIAVIAIAVSVVFFATVLGFFTSYESPICNNTNPIFANNLPESEAYKRELLREFARAGTDNLYYKYKVYFSKNGQDYLMVKAVGRDFCAEFPVNFTNSGKWKFLRETVGNDHLDCELQGFDFDAIAGSAGTEFVFKSLHRIAD